MFDKFGWFHSAFEMCDEDYSRMDYFENKTFVEFLNYRLHWVEHQKEKYKASLKK